MTPILIAGCVAPPYVLPIPSDDDVTTTQISSSSSSSGEDPDGESTGHTSTTGDTGTAGTDSSSGLDCLPGTGSGEPDTCYPGSSEFLVDVQRGVLRVLETHPQWFRWEGDTPYVLEVELYMNAVVSEVGTTLCSIRDPNAGDEIVVKALDNGFAESFDILASAGNARWGDVYTATCAPAWF